MTTSWCENSKTMIVARAVGGEKMFSESFLFKLSMCGINILLPFEQIAIQIEQNKAVLGLLVLRRRENRNTKNQLRKPLC